MKIYNSLTNRKEDFVPMTPGKVNMYACGITVYDACHIGHAMQAIIYDVICHYLRYRGFDVKYVRNYTDVDDKIINRANEQHVNALDYSAQKIVEAEQDLHALRVRDADVSPKASEYIGKIIKFVEGLIANGHAYATDAGDVYFDVASFPEYGKLSNRNSEELLAGVRKEVAEGKRSHLDFALWKSAKPGEISWTSPWGEGRPGWHIECSVMSIDNLGETFDIHGGGRDLIFPHHENEIAQSEALTGKPFAHYWIHNGLITVKGQKMSKSLGNSMTIREALALYAPDVIRFVMLSKHYASDLDIDDTTFVIAERQTYYFYNTLALIDEFAAGANPDDAPADDIIDSIESEFVEAMDDDFNTSAAIGQFFSVFKYANTLMGCKAAQKAENAAKVAKIKRIMLSVGDVLGMLQDNPVRFVADMKAAHLKKLGITEDEIFALIAKRAEAKSNKDYASADEVRNGLLERGIAIKDTPAGTTYDIRSLYANS